MVHNVTCADGRVRKEGDERRRRRAGHETEERDCERTCTICGEPQMTEASGA
jgi:hypothetical protein